jgi:hypothetical protein
MEMAIAFVLFCGVGFGLEVLAGYFLRRLPSRAGTGLALSCTFLGYALFGLAATIIVLRLSGHGPVVSSILSAILHPFR